MRHAHVWIPLAGLTGHIFHSPAHHHIHHSDSPEHYDRNMGFALSLSCRMPGFRTC